MPLSPQVTEHQSGGDNTTRTALTIVLQVSRVALLWPELSDCWLLLQWQGKTIQKTALKNAPTFAPVMLSVPANVRVDSVFLQLVLQGTHEGTRKDVSRAKLGLQYFLNVPLWGVEHALDSGLCPGLHAASLVMTSKVRAVLFGCLLWCLV